MANPFDQFDDSNNPFDQFDKVEEPGLFSKGADLAGGVAETLTTGAVDAFAGLGAQAIGSVKGALTPGMTASQGRDELSKAYSESKGGKLLAPQTESGKAIMDWIGHQVETLKDDAGRAYLDQIKADAPDAIKKLGIGLATVVGTTPEAAMLAGLRPRTGGVKLTDSTLDRVKEAQDKIDAAKTANPFDKFDVERPDIDLSQGPATGDRVIPVTKDGQAMVGEYDSLYHNKYTDDLAAKGAEEQARQDVQAKQDDAQRSIDERQAAMEQDVAKQGGFDYNAAERGRQEEATLPPEQDPVLSDPNVPQEHKDWYQMLLDESSKDDKKTSGTPGFYKEPDANFPSQTKINSYMGNKQRGAVWFGQEKARNQIEKVLGKDNMLSDKPDMDAAVEASKGLPDFRGLGVTEAGATLAAMKRRSPFLQALARTGQFAEKVGDKNIRDNVLPVERAFRKLSRDQLETLSGVIKEEMLRKERFHPDAIATMPAEMQAAYSHMRNMLDDNWRIQNEQRVADGHPPITKMEAYAASMWQGDFRRPIFEKWGDDHVPRKNDPPGKLVWYLAADSKLGIESQTKALLKKFPDLIVDKTQDHHIRSYKREPVIQSAYPTIIDILGRNDPAVQHIKDYIENQTVNETASILGQKKHFEPKAGVRGFVGDRPGKEGFSEALKFIQQQIQYSKNAYKWSAMQSVSGELKKAISDPVLTQTQPNNVKYARDYVKRLLGQDEHKAVAALADSFREGLGFSPAMIGRGISNMKTFFIVQKLASAGQTISNLIQPVNMIAHLVSKEFGNFPSAVAKLPSAYAVGIAGGMSMATGHYVNFIRDIKSAVSPDQLGFYQRAFRYAEDNGITARSIMDESPIGSSFSAAGMVGKGLGKFVSTPEAFARSIAFMTAVQFLKDSGKFGKDMDLFSKAEDLVNAGMVDYRSNERPLMFGKMGGVGNALNTLQNYPMNWYNQFNLFAREGIKGNPAPFLAFLATQYAIAGAMGIPGFSDVDKTYQFLKNNVISKFPTLYAKVQDSDFWVDPKMWVVKNFGDSPIYGTLSSKSGLGLTSRLNTPGMTDMIQAPGGPAVDLIKQGINAVKAVANPNRDTIAQSAMSSVPLGAQGLVENLPQFEGSTYEDKGNGIRAAMMPGNLAAHKDVYDRDSSDTKARLFGLRTQKETVGREIGYRMSQDEATTKEVQNSIPGKLYAALKVGDKAAAVDYYTAYAKLTGSAITSEQLDREIMDNYVPTIDRATTAMKTVSNIKSVARARALFEQIQKEHQ